MILRHLLGSLVSFVAVLVLVPSFAFAKKDGPTITKTKFENGLTNIFYLDDSNIILGYDIATYNVWRSPDAGESWELVKEAEGEALDIYPHPWNNERAYILGRDTEHWITTDQGKSWRKWNSGKQAARLNNGNPFSFHGRDPKKVLWNGEECTTGGVTIVQPCSSFREGCRGWDTEPTFLLR